jgi:predicted kinase
MLIILSGLPGDGKTTLAPELARQLADATHLRIDTIEQALRNAGVAVVTDEGYRVAYAIAEDNLRLGRVVIADSVNPLAATRSAWHAVAQRAGARFIDVEVMCSEEAEHRRRIETRTADIDGHDLPTWDQVVARKYDRWDVERIVVDAASEEPAASVGRLVGAIDIRANYTTK